MLRSHLPHSYFRSTLFLETFEYHSILLLHILVLQKLVSHDFIQNSLLYARFVKVMSGFFTFGHILSSYKGSCWFLVIFLKINFLFLGDLFILMFLLLIQGSSSCFYLRDKILSLWNGKIVFPSYSIGKIYGEIANL